MQRRLPPLNSLRAFESAARHLSFTKAAEELHVTPAAISQQVKTLENFCDRPLFRRLTRSLILTDAGQKALPALREGLDKLADAAELLMAQEDSHTLTVSVAPSFGAKWLVPRLDRFRATYPEFELRIDASDILVDFSDDRIDIGIRYGRGLYPELHTECLMAEVTMPVCSPALLTGEHPLRRPEDLRHHTLLHVDWKIESESAPSWRMWLRAAGVTEIDPTKGPRFSMENMAVQAAIAGHGVALSERSLVRDDVEAGRLVRPFGPELNESTAFCYYVVYPEAKAKLPKVRAFRDWVLDEGARSTSEEDRQDVTTYS